MAMIVSAYNWFHRLISRQEEKGEYSSGPWPDQIRKRVIAMCRGLRGRLLEFGCGEGLFLIGLRRVNPQLGLYGADNWKEILERAKTLFEKEDMPDIQLAHIREDQLPFEDVFFDVVVCINVIYNLGSFNSVRQAVREMARVLKPGGRLIIEFKNSLNPVLVLKYKLARYYDATIRAQDLPLNTFRLQEIVNLLKEEAFCVTRKAYLGFPCNRFAPIVILEAVKR